MKLRVDIEGSAGKIRGKVWPRDEAESAEWTVELDDPLPNLSGSPGLQGYSAGTTDRSPGAEIYWDNIVVSLNE
jgi:hypothetical protein